jgi:hypothetical protein
VTSTGAVNAVVSGIFLAPTTAGAQAAGAATYTGTDSTTQGTWTGKYGADGQLVANDLNNVPAYSTVSITGSSTFTWTTLTSDPRALQSASGSTSRIASVYFSAATFTFDLNLTDGNPHKISLYLCDWDNMGRAETVSIVDAASQTILSTQTFAAFANGLYASWNVQGHIQVQITRTGGLNAAVNGVFLDPTLGSAAKRR